MDMAHPRVGLADRLERQHPLDQLRQLFLPGMGEQEVIKGLEALALVGAGDGLATAQDVVEQFALGAMPCCDPFPQLPVQVPEVRLYLAEIRQQLARGGRELLVAVALSRGGKHLDLRSEE